MEIDKEIFRNKESIEEITIEQLLALMANNQEKPPKELPECINFSCLDEDDDFLYYGKIKTERCKYIKSVVVKVSKEKVMATLPNLKKINGWEFLDQTIEQSNLSFTQLSSEFMAMGINSWEVEGENDFKLNDKTIDYKRVLIFKSEGQVIKEVELIESFDKETFGIIKK